MRLTGALLVLCLLVSTNLSWAKEKTQECDHDLIGKTLGKKLKVALEEDETPSGYEWKVITLVCKNQPNNANQVIVATFYESLLPAKANDSDRFMFAVAIVDKTKRQVLSLHSEEYAEDATTRFSEYSLRIDTARYDIADGVRAIGVRVNTFHGRCSYKGGWGEELWLFVDKKPQLQPVLKNFFIEQYQHQWLKGSACGGSEDLTGATHTVQLSLSPSTQASQGYRDLIVQADLRSENENMTFQPANERVVVGRLKFDGELFQDTTKGAIEKLFEKRHRAYAANFKHSAQKNSRLFRSKSVWRLPSKATALA